MAVVVAIICRPYGMFVCDMLLLYSMYWVRFFLFFFSLQLSAAAQKALKLKLSVVFFAEKR